MGKAFPHTPRPRTTARPKSLSLRSNESCTRSALLRSTTTRLGTWKRSVAPATAFNLSPSQGSPSRVALHNGPPSFRRETIHNGTTDRQGSEGRQFTTAQRTARTSKGELFTTVQRTAKISKGNRSQRHKGRQPFLCAPPPPHNPPPKSCVRASSPARPWSIARAKRGRRAPSEVAGDERTLVRSANMPHQDKVVSIKPGLSWMFLRQSTLLYKTCLYRAVWKLLLGV